MNVERLVQVGDRVLRTRVLGQGRPVVYAHGAPGSVLEQPVPEAVLSELGLQLVLVERPGFGRSTRHVGRTLATWADDLLAVLDAHRLQEVSVLGWAAGVPYALAAAALAPERITSLSLVGPWFAAEPNDVDPSSPSAVAAYREQLGRAFAPLLQLLIRDPDAGLGAILAQMPGPDRELPLDTRAMLTASGAEAVRQGAEPALDEGVAVHTRWPFAIDTVTCDVEVWTGDADARAASSVRVLSKHLPRARQRAVAGGGHYLVFTHGETILSALASSQA